MIGISSWYQYKLLKTVSPHSAAAPRVSDTADSWDPPGRPVPIFYRYTLPFDEHALIDRAPDHSSISRFSRFGKFRLQETVTKQTA
jgi:hypothetical protein